jgi:hypothetical protein
LKAKQIPSPKVATSQPAMAGPTARAAFTMEELRAMAFVMSSPATSARSAWRAGTSKALVSPSISASAMTWRGWTTPVRVTTASSVAWTAALIWVVSTSRRRGKRSAREPA